ncbi:MAG: hypothetical protein ACOZQL_43585 [Myxococcota bacterium]
MARTRAKKRAPRKSQQSPPPKRALHYKVVELSNVDEASLERTLNEWCPRGWTFDGVQFAMRDSSKRPSMAFVFFTREGPALLEEDAPPVPTSWDEVPAPPRPVAPVSSDPWARLKELAGHDEAGEL